MWIGELNSYHRNDHNHHKNNQIYEGNSVTNQILFCVTNLGNEKSDQQTFKRENKQSIYLDMHMYKYYNTYNLSFVAGCQK